MYPGQYYDQETGLHYNYFRYYNPQTGRYITPDPIGLEGGINLFAYVENQPINKIDPLGLQNIPELPPTRIPFPKPSFPPINPKKKPAPEECPKEDNDKDRCYTREQAEISYCYTRDRQWWLGCITRASTRRDLCLRGLPEPPAWGPADEEVWRNPRK